VELFEHLGEGARTLIRRHPLTPFDPSALTGEGPLATSSPDALALADLLYRGLKVPALSASVLPASLQSDPLPLHPDDGESIDWLELVRFLRNPVEYFYLRCLGPAREAGEEDMAEEDVLEAGFLDWWQWRSSHIAEDPESLRRPDRLVDGFRERLSLEGSVSDTPAGDLQAESWLDDAESLAAGLDRLVDEGLDTAKPFTCRFVPGALLSADSDPPQSGTSIDLPAPVTGGAEDRVLRITGNIGGLRLLSGGGKQDSETWTILDFISGKRVQSRHNLRNWAAALMIGASMGKRRPKEIRIFRLSGDRKKTRRYFFSFKDVPGGDAAGGETAGGDEIIVLNNPSSILRSLVLCFRDGESAPLALYPDLADKLAAVNKKGPVDEHLPAAAAEAWNSIVTDTWAPSSGLRDCYYRQRYLGTPDLTGGAFRRAWENLYMNGGIL